MKADDVVMVEAPVDGDLGGHLLPLVLLQDQRLGDDFPGENLLRLQIRDFVAFGEAAFAEELAPRISLGGPTVDQNVGDFFERSRFGVDMCRRVCRLRDGCAHFGSI